MPLTPNNREEHWLQGMVDGQTTLEPNKRREYWYKEIVDAIGSGGGGGEALVLTVDNENRLNKTWQEIKDAYDAGKQIFADASFSSVANVRMYLGAISSRGYVVAFILYTESVTLMQFIAESADDYPVMQMG